MNNFLQKLKRFLLNEKRVLKLLGIEQPQNQQEKQYVLSCDPLLEFSDLQSKTDPLQLQFRIKSCKTIEIQILFDVLVEQNQIKAAVQTVPQHFEQFNVLDKDPEAWQLFEVVCKNVLQEVKNCYILVTGIGQVGGSDVAFQMFEVDLAAQEVVKEVIKVNNDFYEMQKIYGTTTPGDENKTGCCICFDENPKIVAMPCRHLILCRECAEKFRVRS